MKRIILTVVLIMTIAVSATAQEKIVYVHDTVFVEKPAADTADDIHQKNNWGAILKDSNFHLSLDLQTKYIWRGIEMMTENACPVIFPNINYQWNGLYVYVMGGYAFNGKYSELDLGISYTWKGVTIGFNDYFYPNNYDAYDKYFTGGKESKHWLEVCINYAPEKVPIWVTISNFFYSPTDTYINNIGEVKKAYSTYFELGTYYDFLRNNRIALAVGMTPYASWYNNYQQKFSVCNVDLKYTYTVHFKNSDWNLPLSGEFIYNPVFEKPFFNIIASLAF